MQRGAWVISIRFWEQAFTENPALPADVRAGYRDRAARAAVRAAADGNLGITQAAHARAKALEWLSADLAAYRALLREGQGDGLALVKRRLRTALGTADLATVRGDAIAKLPTDEQKAWRAFWSKVGPMLVDLTFPVDPFASPADRDEGSSK